MNTRSLIAVTALALLAATGFAQGKGGGKSGGGENRGGKGHSVHEHPSTAPAPEKPDLARESNSPRSRSSDADSSAPPRLPAHAEGKGKAERSASGPARELAASMKEINQTSFAQRSELHDSLDMRLESSRQTLKQIQADAKRSRADARAEFKAALNEVKVREGELKDSLKTSRKADEASWEAGRSHLARAYQNHADAVARLEAVARSPEP